VKSANEINETTSLPSFFFRGREEEPEEGSSAFCRTVALLVMIEFFEIRTQKEKKKKTLLFSFLWT
jgi:hypothetical protein